MAQTLVYLDTHVVAWLYEGRTDLFPPAATACLEENDLVISPMVLLELQYLREIGRITRGPDVILSRLQARIDLQVCNLSFHEAGVHAVKESWTQDPFDRLIVAQARATQSMLVTKDRLIAKHFKQTVWR